MRDRQTTFGPIYAVTGATAAHCSRPLSSPARLSGSFRLLYKVTDKDCHSLSSRRSFKHNVYFLSRDEHCGASNCTFLTYEEQELLFNVKFWLEGVAQVIFFTFYWQTSLKENSIINYYIPHLNIHKTFILNASIIFYQFSKCQLHRIQSFHIHLLGMEQIIELTLWQRIMYELWFY